MLKTAELLVLFCVEILGFLKKKTAELLVLFCVKILGFLKIFIFCGSLSLNFE